MSVAPGGALSTARISVAVNEPSDWRPARWVVALFGLAALLLVPWIVLLRHRVAVHAASSALGHCLGWIRRRAGTAPVHGRSGGLPPLAVARGCRHGGSDAFVRGRLVRCPDIVDPDRILGLDPRSSVRRATARSPVSVARPRSRTSRCSRRTANDPRGSVDQAAAPRFCHGCQPRVNA